MDGSTAIPNWILMLIIPGVVSWMVWITLNTFGNKSDIKLNDANDQSFRSEIRKDIAEIKSNFQNLTSAILNQFGHEIELLKSHIGMDHK